MADLPPTQKQTAAKYTGNLAYFRRPHYLRRLRWWAFAVAAVASILVVAVYQRRGKQDIFSTGPISENHARFARDCRVCHPAAESDLLQTLLSQHDESGLLKASVPATSAKVLAPTSVSLMDRACLQCHPTRGLHLPQAAGLALRAVSSEMNVAHAAACASCHREHVGHGRMPAPEPQRCVSCHDSADELRRARRSVKLDHSPVAASGENRALADGLVRFIAPTRPVGTLPPFATYAAGHPPFSYEQPGMKDPGVLQFNHERHLRSDIPSVQGRRLDCASCHQPGPGGVLYRPVRYQDHCAQCHSLQLDPNLPKMLVPHGDPEKVRYFLASLDVSLEYALRADGVSDPTEIAKRVAEERQALQRRGLNSLTDLENRVFFEGDPREERGDRRPRAGARRFLTPCAKCHEVEAGSPSHAPQVQRPNIAMRWVQRGPFTHLPHEHMECVDCHGAARTSKLTSDILLPPQALCAECHRPADPLAGSSPDAAGDPQAVAAAQRRTGGVKADCQSCHLFHSPPGATAIIQAIAAPSALPGAADRR